MAEQDSNLNSILGQVSLVTANYGEGVVFAEVINDWFEFLGGKPGEVVVVDCGSDASTQNICWQLFQSGVIDKLQLIHSSNDDFGRDKGYIKEYTAGAIASKPYVLLFKTDTLPYREGNEEWLVDAVAYLDRDDVFAVGGSFNLPSKHHEAWAGWYFSHKCSYNFALMKREKFMAAVHEFANNFVLAGFQGENPAAKTMQDRYFTEVAFEDYMERHNLYTLVKVEEPNWTVFHTNTHDERLKQVREQYRARRKIKKYMNLGNSDEALDPAKALYYGFPTAGPLKRLRIAFGKSTLGIRWRELKQQILRKPQSSASS
ncbi:MAG: glycosyltransferase family 2 protein [Elainella sp.]